MTERSIYISYYLVMALIQIALIILRMTDTIKSSWWLVLIPIWIEIVSNIGGLIVEIIKGIRNK